MSTKIVTKPCKKCGSYERYASNGNCPTCAKAYARNFAATRDPEKKKESNRKYRDKRRGAAVSKTYHGTPCKKYGHTLRYTKTGICVECCRVANAKRLATRQTRQRQKAWRERNKDRVEAHNQRYYKNNKEQINKNAKDYKKRNRELINTISQKRRAAKSSADGSFTHNEWIDLCNKHDNKCLACGSRSAKLTIDHVVPLSEGGTNFIDNIQPLCQPCNSSKGTKTIDYRS